MESKREGKSYVKRSFLQQKNFDCAVHNLNLRFLGKWDTEKQNYVPGINELNLRKLFYRFFCSH